MRRESVLIQEAELEGFLDSFETVRAEGQDEKRRASWKWFKIKTSCVVGP
jgi:hypothetical protein